MIVADKKRIGLFYHRDSGGRAETTPSEYIAWAMRRARELNVEFDCETNAIERMIAQRQCRTENVFFDFDISGNQLSRPGLDALLAKAKNLALTASVFVFIVRRDRLSRPTDPVDAMNIEKEFGDNGITIVYTNRVCSPVAKGRRAKIEDSINSVVDFYRAGEERHDLAQKSLYSQANLAAGGFSVGGRAPYGFRRWLVAANGTPIRQLEDGERVRLSGHHVVPLPGPEDEIETIRRILTMLDTMRASHVARILNTEEVPSPNAGRFRTDGGVRHRVSGKWNQDTINGIARNPLLRGKLAYGRRSMGDQMRCGPNGPRELEDSDFGFGGKPKVILNPHVRETDAAASFDPIVDSVRHSDLLKKLDERSGTQKGKPRSRNPDQNPLGARVFDIKCTWPMYRVPCGKSFRYKCGLYQQTHAQQCNHNSVDGVTATKFALACLRQRILAPGLIEQIEANLRAMAKQDQQLNPNNEHRELVEIQNRISAIDSELELASHNLAKAKNDAQYDAMSIVFDQLTTKKAKLAKDVGTISKKLEAPADFEKDVDRVLESIRSLVDLADQPANLTLAKQLFDITNCKLFLGFERRQSGKRILDKVKGGVITFGNAQPPIEVYAGPTSRSAIKSPKVLNCSNRNDHSLRNVSRGDRIRTCDL